MQFKKYTLAAFSALGLSWAVSLSLFYFAGIEGTLSHICGDISGFLLQYFLLLYYVYKIDPSLKNFILYGGTFLLGLIISSFFFITGFHVIGAGIEASKGAAIVLTFFINFHIRNKLFGTEAAESFCK